ncbi:MAG: hypothetical protein ACK4YP_16790 [Myxococcota bacterium]
MNDAFSGQCWNVICPLTANPTSGTRMSSVSDVTRTSPGTQRSDSGVDSASAQ